MNIVELNKQFGICYNGRGFGSLEQYLDPHVVYDSYDCMYSISGRDEVIDILTHSKTSSTTAYTGYYRYRGIFFWHLKECVIICDTKSLECIRLIQLTKRRGRIVTITGRDPRVCSITRGHIIT